MKKSAWLVVASAMLASSAMAGSVVYPAGSLGALSDSPALFGDVKVVNSLGGASFSDVYNFTVGQNSVLKGTVGEFVGSISFTQLLINSTPVTLTATNTGYSFSLSGLAAGSHTLTVAGTMPKGGHGYIGTVYATPAVPEPESIALAVAGLGVVASLARRRRQA